MRKAAACGAEERGSFLAVLVFVFFLPGRDVQAAVFVGFMFCVCLVFFFDGVGVKSVEGHLRDLKVWLLGWRRGTRPDQLKHGKTK